MLSKGGMFARRSCIHVASRRIPMMLQKNRQNLPLRYFSSNDDLKETLRKVKEDAEAKSREKADEKTEDASAKETSDQVTPSQASGPSIFSTSFDYAKKGVALFVENVKLAYEELTASEKKDSYVKRKLDIPDATPSKKKNEDDDDEEPKETGPSAIVVVKEQKSPWEQMRDRLQDSPLIREMMKQGKRVSQVAGETDLGKKVQNAGQSIRDKIEDAREFWETSQNPLVYTISGAWETVSGDTEESLTIQAIRRLDPQFDKEEFLAEVRDNLIPKVVKAHMAGDLKTLREWCGEAAYQRLAADIRTRKNDNLVFNDTILNVDEMQALFKVNEQDNNPYIVCHYQVQQINCIKKRGEIIEVSLSRFCAVKIELVYYLR